MAKKQNSTAKMTVLLVVMGILAVLLLRQYLPAIQLPTDGAIQDELLRLDSRQKDLENARVVRREIGNELQRLRAKSSGFWVRKCPGNAVEQEVLDEFNNIVRLAGINVQSREAKLNKVQNSMYVQEVEIHADIRGVTMKEFMRFLKEIDANARRFHWSACKIDPDNVNKPTGIRANCHLKAYLLSEDAMRLLSSETGAVETQKDSVQKNVNTGGGSRRQSSSGARVRNNDSASDNKPERPSTHGNRRGGK